MNNITKIENLPTRQAASPSMLIEMAIDKQADIATLERLFNLQKDWEANEARKVFVQAMVDFKSESLVIEKKRLVSYDTPKGNTSYHHADLADVVAVVVPAMARHGLSHRWTVEQKETNITVSCVVTHAQGHSESVTMVARPDDSGGKNSIQSIASSVNYLQRYTLLAATGTATGGEDNDGRGDEQGYAYDPKVNELIESAKAAANQGWEALKKWWEEASDGNRTSIGHMITELQEKAKAVTLAKRAEDSKKESGNE